MKLRILYLLLPFFFTGCAQLPDTPIQKNNSWEIHQTQLNQLTHWTISGKLGVFSPNGRDSVDLYWQQSGQDFHIRLTALLGLKSVDIQKRGDKTVIIDKDGQQHVSNNTEQLVTELTGIVLPIAHLQQWIKGNPVAANYQLDENQLVSSLIGGNKVSGLWSIDYLDYRTINHTNLPHKMQLIRNDLRLKFAISRWETSSTPTGLSEDNNAKN